MNVWQRISFCSAALLLALWPASGALGATVSGRASTVLEWFDDGQGDTAVPLYQYLLFNAGDLDGKGLSFKGYGRLADDLNNEADIDSRLYYAYLEKNGLIKNLDLKLGRQFIATTAGATVMDGLFLDYKGLGPLGLRLFGGGDVKYYEGYNARDLIAGGEIYGHFFGSLDAGFSYVQRWDGGDLANELFGLDLAYDYQDALSLYSETQYDYLSDSVSFFLAGAHYHASPRWSLRGEYLYSLPVFSSASIFSVFAVDEYEELMAELTCSIDPGLRAFARATREMYQEVDAAMVYEAGIEKIRTDRFSGYLSGVWRDDGEGQDLRGVKAHAAWLFGQYLQAGVGADVDVLERRLDIFGATGADLDETTSSRYWLDATSYLSKTVNVEGKVERVESDLWDEYYRGRVRLNILF